MSRVDDRKYHDLFSSDVSMSMLHCLDFLRDHRCHFHCASVAVPMNHVADAVAYDDV